MTFNIDKVKEAIYDLAEWEKVSLWNERCENYHYMEDYIQLNLPDEFLCGKTPSDVLSAIHLGEYSLNDEYACDTVYGYVSFTYVEDSNSPFDIDELIEWYCEYDGYEQTDILDYEELLEDEDEEDADED